MDNPGFRNSFKDIDTRLARYDEDQPVLNDNCKSFSEDSDDFLVSTKRTKFKLPDDVFAQSEGQHPRNARQVQVSEASRVNFNLIQDRRRMYNDSPRMFNEIPNSSQNETFNDFKPYSNMASTSDLPSTSSEFYASSGEFSRDKRKVKKQNQQYDNPSHCEIYAKSYGKQPDSHLSSEEDYYDNITTKQISYPYQKSFVLPKHIKDQNSAYHQDLNSTVKDSEIYYKTYGSKYRNTSLNFAEQEAFVYLKQRDDDFLRENLGDASKLENTYRYSKHSHDFTEENDGDKFSKKEHGYKNYKKLNPESSHWRSKNPNLDIDSEIGEKYYNAYLSRKDNLRLQPSDINSSFQQKPTNSNLDVNSKSDEEYYNAFLSRKNNLQMKATQNHRYTSKASGSEPKFDENNSTHYSLEQNRTDKYSSSKTLINRSHASSDSNYYYKTKQNNHVYLPYKDEYRLHETRQIKSDLENVTQDVEYQNVNHAQFGSNRRVHFKRRHVWNDEILPDPENNELEENNITSRRSRTDTFSMSDACKMASLVRLPVREHSEQNPDFLIADEGNYFKNKRKCWTKACWSTTRHSHASLSSRVEALSAKRKAIVSSMKTPQHATKPNQKTADNSFALDE